MPITDPDARALGVDLAVPTDPDAAIPITPSGDLQLVSGRDNLLPALDRRQRAAPGELLHRPDYGVGAVHLIGRATTPAQRGLLAARARRNLLQDSRIKEARVTVQPGFPGEETPTPNAVTLATRVEIRHDGTAAVLSTPLGFSQG